MTANLYLPGQPPQPVPAEGFALPTVTRFAQVPPQAAQLLSCTPGLVDVLASGDGYVVYSVFDSEDAANPEATSAVAELTGMGFNIDDEDELLRGPVLVVQV